MTRSEHQSNRSRDRSRIARPPSTSCADKLAAGDVTVLPGSLIYLSLIGSPKLL